MIDIDFPIEIDVNIQFVGEKTFPGFCQTCGVTAEYLLTFSLNDKSLVIRLTCKKDFQKYYSSLWQLYQSKLLDQSKLLAYIETDRIDHNNDFDIDV